MKSMFGLLGILTSATFQVYADGPVCHHCEEIRLYNKEHHQNFEYYDDYLKSLKEDSSADSTESDKPETVEQRSKL